MSSNILTDSTAQIKASSTAKPGLELQYFRGVGPTRAQRLADRGITSVTELILTLPRDWEDRRVRFNLRQAPMGQKVALRGAIRDVQFSITRSHLGIATAELDDAFGGHLQAAWFKRLNPRYDVFAPLRRQLRAGETILVFGSIEWGPAGRQLRVDDFARLNADGGWLNAEDAYHFERIVPVYPLSEGISERLLRAMIAQAIQSNAHAARFPSVVPDAAAPRDAWSALRAFHFPKTLVEAEEARQILALEEFLILETALAIIRARIKKKNKPHAYTLKRTLLTPFRERLGFELTAAQKRVIREIFADLSAAAPMNRLLQGDVGSGKTLVALSAMLLAVESGGQAALMAPTEILAEQHAATFAHFLRALPLRAALITGRHAPSQKRKLAEQVARGEVDIVIGTHAIIQKHVRFPRLMLAVIDEQHRFGVEHRSLLRQKGDLPDVLVMTATPIPRTLALTIYGDLDVSTVDELPPGRTPVVTQHRSEDDAHMIIRAAVAQGRQAYIVYPLVKESDKLELKAAVQEADRLKNTVFVDLRVAVLHGQLKPTEKESVLEAFRKGAIDVLIATSIIEVGIDVPNATVMVIQHAERFGLAALHQLRGRVGRGAAASQCVLVAEVKSEDARRRIDVMTQTNDGFKISEEDLSLRGPGEILGLMQHGVPEFKVGDLVRDAHLIHRAREMTRDILSKDPTLAQSRHAALRQAVARRFGRKADGGITG